jgi:hypothetical protein
MIRTLHVVYCRLTIIQETTVLFDTLSNHVSCLFLILYLFRCVALLGIYIIVIIIILIYMWISIILGMYFHMTQGTSIICRFLSRTFTTTNFISSRTLINNVYLNLLCRHIGLTLDIKKYLGETKICHSTKCLVPYHFVLCTSSWFISHF